METEDNPKAGNHRVILSLASNYEQKNHLSEARRRLGQVMCSLSFTDELWSEPYAVKQKFSVNQELPKPLYLNQLAQGVTGLSVDELTLWLKQTEIDMGRTADARAKGIVGIDLDLMLYDSVRYHERDWTRPYITPLLSQIEG